MRIALRSRIAMGSTTNVNFSNAPRAHSLETTKRAWRNADAVCFDVDSTVCRDEGIDELARFVGKGEEVSLLTKQAMRGGMKFQDALRIRLEAIRPTVETVQKFVTWNPPKLTPHVKTLVGMLHERHVPVYLISGGFSSIVRPVADALRIPTSNTFCNKLKFYYDGRYAGFDEDEPTSHSGGKGEVIQMLKNKFRYEQLVMVGDGMTDLEACPPADAFVGFGGNQVREEVRKKAKWFVTDFQDLINELQMPAEPS